MTHKLDPYYAPISSQVAHATGITDELLCALIDGNVMALSIEGFADPENCRLVGRMLREDEQFRNYRGVQSLYHWGLVHYGCLADPLYEKRYFSQAIHSIQEMRRLWSPFLSPIDRLRLELEESWSSGANLLVRGGRKLFVGQVRALPEGAELVPHQDYLSYELPVGSEPALDAQLTANIYLESPRAGGELELWRRGYPNHEYERLSAGPGKGFDRNQIGEPDAVISTMPGQLTLIHSTRVHAVRPSSEWRTSMSCFVGYQTRQQPLFYWS